MSKNTIQEFISEEGFKIRQLSLDGQTWFIAADVAKCIGLENRKISQINIEPKDKKHLTFKEFQGCFENTLGIGHFGVTIVTEAGMYDIIMQARSSAVAHKFQRWVTHVVLPSIRANGGYILGQEDLSAEDAEELNKEIRELSRKVDRLTARVQNLQDRNEQLKEVEFHVRLENDSLMDTISELRFLLDKSDNGDEEIELEDGTIISKDEYEDNYARLKGNLEDDDQ